jgi:hypothetical protein
MISSLIQARCCLAASDARRSGVRQVNVRLDDGDKWFIRKIGEVPWRDLPEGFGKALSRSPVMPETAGSRDSDGPTNT